MEPPSERVNQNGGVSKVSHCSCLVVFSGCPGLLGYQICPVLIAAVVSSHCVQGLGQLGPHQQYPPQPNMGTESEHAPVTLHTQTSRVRAGDKFDSTHIYKERLQNSLSVTTNKPQRMTNVGD